MVPKEWKNGHSGGQLFRIFAGFRIALQEGIYSIKPHHKWLKSPNWVTLRVNSWKSWLCSSNFTDEDTAAQEAGVAYSGPHYYSRDRAEIPVRLGPWGVPWQCGKSCIFPCCPHQPVLAPLLPKSSDQRNWWWRDAEITLSSKEVPGSVPWRQPTGAAPGSVVFATGLWLSRREADPQTIRRRNLPEDPSSCMKTSIYVFCFQLCIFILWN